MKAITVPLFTALIFLLPSPVLSALPNVSTIPLGSNDCSRWPGFVDFDYTTPINLVVHRAQNTSANGLLTTIQDFILPGNITGTRLIVDARKSGTAHPTYRCESGTLRLQPKTNGTSTETSTPGFADTIISIATDYRNAFFILGDDGYRIAPYGHEIDGVVQEGVYLGTRGRSTWGFHYVPAGGRNPEHYEIRLAGGTPSEDEAGVLTEPEFYGFLRVVQV